MNLPAKTDFSTTALGVRPRELVISGVAGFLGLALLTLPLGSIFVRILIAAGLTSAGVLYAFWRVHRVWTVEAYLYRRLVYDFRTRRFLKGGAAAAGFSAQAETDPGATPSASTTKAAAPPAGVDQAQPLFWLPAALSPRSNRELVGLVGAWFAVTVFVGWMLASGGIEDVQVHLRLLWSALWRG
jgi:hypothetical protein